MKGRRLLSWTLAALSLAASLFVAYRACFDWWMCAYPHPAEIRRLWEVRLQQDVLVLIFLFLFDLGLGWFLIRKRQASPLGS